ncbi:MAG: aminoacyl-tRNA hydrolase [Clostridiales bacterium]|nr:aminoacyl-tRNA hydrolase [Clostridiales bacterium]
MWLIAGLGNPGDKYAYNRHNCGFLTAEMIADKTGIRIDRTGYEGTYGKGRYEGREVVILKPKTYMNNSGISVAKAANFFKIKPSHIIIIYDDIDIPTGSIRVRAKGSAGTHNGMKSVIAHLGTQEFPRVRIGMGPKPEDRPLADYVLSDIPKEERQTVFDSFEAAADAALEYVKEND